MNDPYVKLILNLFNILVWHECAILKYQFKVYD